MKYIEAEKKIKALSSKYDIDMEDGDFNIVHNGKNYEIYVSGDSQYRLFAGNPRYFSKLPFCNNLYMILAELAMTPLDERAEEKKYFIHVFEGSVGYLNVNILMSKTSLDNSIEMPGIETKFTLKEIEHLKQRGDIPLDWDKVSFEEAN